MRPRTLLNAVMMVVTGLILLIWNQWIWGQSPPVLRNCCLGSDPLHCSLPTPTGSRPTTST